MKPSDRDPAMILLLGRCGLERLAQPLRALGHQVAVGAWTDLDLVERLKPQLVYVDLFEWELQIAGVAATLMGGAAPELGPRRAVIDALAAQPRPVLYRGLRPTPWGFPPHPTALNELLSGLLSEQDVLDVGALWARHGILQDAVRSGPGHGEAELGDLGCSRLSGESAAQIEAGTVHAAWRARVLGPCKCVVVDLDNTLIHGLVTADDFAERNPAWGLAELSAEDAELAWWRVPRGLHLALRELQRRGLVLALATRNGRHTVLKRFVRAGTAPGLSRQAPGLALGLTLDRHDFVWIEAGFDAKSQMLQRIAAGLGLSTDSLVFVDDSPVERAEVHASLPAVRCVDPAAAWSLVELAETTVHRVSPAMAKRQASYRSRATVAQLGSDPKLLDFLVGLELRLTVRPAQPGDLPRVRELFLRSHQLVLTTARPQLATTQGLLVASLTDRMADHGLVAAGLFADQRLVAWACSCRVMPHRVAATILWAMQQQQPGATCTRQDTGRNAATIGLIEEAKGGSASWICVVDGATGPGSGRQDRAAQKLLRPP